MKRTVEVEVEVADDDAYADLIAAVVGAVKQAGDLRDLRYTRSSAEINKRLRAAHPNLDWKQFSGSVHG